MRYLKGYKIFENKEDIHAICKKYGITNYAINYDGSIDVDGDVKLADKHLTKLPLNFRNISGSFYCHRNYLMTLEGAPKVVGGGFDCGHNQLTSLEGSPESVRGYFYCDNNQLTSLLGSTKSVGDNFDCNDNQLTSLKGAPMSVVTDFNCSNNQLTSLEGAPMIIGGDFECSNNQLMSLEYVPESVGGVFFIDNPVRSVIYTWINIKDRRWELMEYFEEMNVIQGDQVILPRLIAFCEDMNVEIPNIKKIEKHYKIIE